jgi:hypothetical protein
MTGSRRSRARGSEAAPGASPATPTEARDAEAEENKTDAESVSSGPTQQPAKTRRTNDEQDMPVEELEQTLPEETDLKQMMMTIMKSVAAIESQLTSVDQRLVAQAGALASITEAMKQVHQKIADLEKKTAVMEENAKTEQDLLEARINSMKDIFSGGGSPAAATPHREPPACIQRPVIPPSSYTAGSRDRGRDGGDAWADYNALRGGRSAPTIATTPSARPTPQHRNAADGPQTDKTKYTSTQSDLVWVKGYPRDLTTKQLRAEASRILDLHDVDMDEVDIIVRGFGRNFAIKFMSSDLARDFREEARDSNHAWTDPRDKDIHPLKFHSDKPLFVRLRDRIFAYLWNKVLPKVLAVHPHAKLGQSRGKLWSIVDDCPLALFASRPDPEDPAKFILEADEKGCMDYHISKDEANTWMAQALRVVA